MRGLLFGIVLMACAALGPANAADRAAPDHCLSTGDALDVVTAHQVVTPGAAIVVARQAVPNADVLRASLCRDPASLVYLIMTLRKDGRLVRVVVDAPSGKVKTVH